MGTELQTTINGGLASQVVNLIALQNSDIDNAMLMNKINMIIAKTPKIASMPPDVISQAILKAMIPDQTLQDHDDIYFIPYGNKIDVSFSHNYLQKLAYRNGAIKLIETYLIYENDNVTVTEKGVSYSINPFRSDKGAFVGVMVVVKLSNGETKHGFVSLDHIEKAKKASKSSVGNAWRVWYDEMAKKVALKNTFKSLDISSEFNAAVIIDNENTDFSKSSQEKIPNEANELKNMMEESSTNVENAEKYISSLGISFEIKGDWIAIDILNSEESGLRTLNTKMNLIKKMDRPGMLFGKITDLNKKT